MSLSWACGLFEGEGCISPRLGSKRVYIRVGSTDLDVLENFQKAVGCGAIHKRKAPTKSHWKQAWEWSCGKQSDVKRLLTSFLPLLGSRRAYVALNALDYMEL